MEIQNLKERATFSEDALQACKTSAARKYNPYESFVFQSALSMLQEIQSLYKEGYTPADMPSHIEPPSFYQVYLTKPESVQEAEIQALLDHAETQYHADLLEAKEIYAKAIAEKAVLDAEESERIRAERKREKAFNEALSNARKEVGL